MNSYLRENYRLWYPPDHKKDIALEWHHLQLKTERTRMLRLQRVFRWFSKDSQEQESVDISSPLSLSSSYFQRVLKAKVSVGTIIRSRRQVLLNEGQCEWLESRLREAVQCAQDAFSTLPTQRFEQLLRNFYLKVKDVEILVEQCCAKPWLTNAFLFAGSEEYFVLKGQELRWFQALFKHVKQGSESGLWLEGVPILAMFERGERQHMEVLLQDLEENAKEDRAKLRRNLEEVISKSASVADSDLARNLLNRLDLKSERSSGVAKAAPHVMWKVDPKELEYGKSLGSGAGGARVYETTWLKQPFARKMFNVSHESVFEQEAAFLAGLQHPHILPMVCTAVDSARGTCSLVTELMSEDLDSVIVRNGSFSLPVALDLMLQVAEGMTFLHKKRVVHKDLKSSNILVRPVEDPNLASEGFVCAKVADFGLSKTKEESATRSQLTLNIGTTRWMAPELLEVTNDDGTKYSLPDKEFCYHFSVDVYSYAITFSEVLIGKSPYHNLVSNTEIKKQVMAEYLRPELPVTCPIGLATLIVKCWDEDASQRPSFAKISKELRHIKGQMLMGVQPSFALEPLSKLYKIVAGEGPFISSSWPEPLAAFMERFREMEPRSSRQNICNELRHIQGLLFTEDSQEQESVDISSPLSLSSSYFQRVLKAKVSVGTIIRSRRQVLLNEGQCEWLESRLREAVECAQDAFSTRPTQRFEQLLRNFYLKVKDVEILVEQCCAKPWLTNAFLFAGSEEYFVLKGQELRWFQALFKHVKQGSESGLWLEGVPILAMFEREEGDHTEVLLEELEVNAWEDRTKLTRNLEEVISKSASVADSDLARNLLDTLDLKSERSSGVAKAAPHVMWKVDPKELGYGKRLGSGAHGAAVYETTWLKQPFARKVFHVSHESVFEREAAILAVLQHPHILPMVCTAVDSARGTCSLVTGLMSEDLQSLIDRNGSFSLPVALDLMLQVAEGMKFLHKKRVVHKDLKSSNILVKPVEDPNLASEGFVCAKVAGFGLAETMEESATRSQLTLNIGTTRWMAPELLEVTNADGTSYSLPSKVLYYYFRVDVYSYAITFSEVLAGKFPYHDLFSNTEIKKKVMWEYLRPELPTTCPIGLATLIVKCWDEDASQRPSFAKISKELRHIKGQMLMGVQPSFALEPLSKLYKIVAGEGPFISSSWPEPLAAFMERFREMETRSSRQNICNELRHIQGLLFTEDDMGARERAAKTAAASRRWREYSRQGADRRGFRILPSQSESENEKKERKTPAVK